MSIQITHPRWGPRWTTTLVAAAFPLAVSVPAFQLSSIWTNRTGSPARDPATISRQVNVAVGSLPALVHSGRNRGQVRFGPLGEQPSPTPRTHGPAQRPKWGS